MYLCRDSIKTAIKYINFISSPLKGEAHSITPPIQVEGYGGDRVKRLSVGIEISDYKF